MIENLVFFLEGRSEKEMLEGLIPRLLEDHREIDIQYFIFQGKRDLESKFHNRLKEWSKPKSVFVVLVDQDNENCKKLKKRLLDKCESTTSLNLVIRIACHELESWYFGDLTAVAKALEKENLVNYKNKSNYRKPDKIQKPSEKLSKITGGVYQKISGSRAIGLLLSLDENTSPSFQVFIKEIKKLCET